MRHGSRRSWRLSRTSSVNIAVPHSQSICCLMSLNFTCRRVWRTNPASKVSSCVHTLTTSSGPRALCASGWADSAAPAGCESVGVLQPATWQGCAGLVGALQPATRQGCAGLVDPLTTSSGPRALCGFSWADSAAPAGWKGVGVLQPATRQGCAGLVGALTTSSGPRALIIRALPRDGDLSHWRECPATRQPRVRVLSSSLIENKAWCWPLSLQSSWQLSWPALQRQKLEHTAMCAWTQLVFASDAAAASMSQSEAR